MKKSEVCHDQFFTKLKVVKLCLELISKFVVDVDIFIEPSAGSGNFYNQLPANKRIGLDIESQFQEIIECDFLKWDLPNNLLGEKVCFVGNPPFGKNSSLAIKFFNRSALLGDSICFILPRTFRKSSVINRLNEFFHLQHQIILPENSFELIDGTSYSVPTVFQIWIKKDFKREKIKTNSKHPDWEWTSKEYANISIRRVGINAGKVFNHTNVSESSHYFLKTKDIDKVFNNLKSIFEEQWNPKTCSNLSCKYDTAGNPSLSKAEIVKEYRNLMLNQTCKYKI